ncbi:MAG TPA: DedA family protein [Campylobacterales bacterium]|nr:DedA family protein [Campylobacterales bacterium]
MGYLGFFFYMILVGTFIPLPTQLILLPAGYLVSQGKLDMPTIIVVTALGTSIGASINYFLANYISKKFMSQTKVAKVKKFFSKYGKVSVFLAPLTFGLGQYISVPAGMAKMDLRWFLPLIFVSNSLWNFAMLMLGYLFGENANSQVIYVSITAMLLVIGTISIFVYKELKSY